jgi:hypothetical protein
MCRFSGLLELISKTRRDGGKRAPQFLHQWKFSGKETSNTGQYGIAVDWPQENTLNLDQDFAILKALSKQPLHRCWYQRWSCNEYTIFFFFLFFPGFSFFSFLFFC